MDRVAIRNRNTEVTNAPNMGDDSRHIDACVVPVPECTNKNQFIKQSSTVDSFYHKRKLPVSRLKCRRSVDHHGCKDFCGKQAKGVLLTCEEPLPKCSIVTEHLVPLRSSPIIGHHVDVMIGKVNKFRRDELPEGIHWVKPPHSGKTL